MKRSIPRGDGRGAHGWLSQKALVALAVACLSCACAISAGAQPSPAAPSSVGPVTTAELVETKGLSGLAVSPDQSYAVVRIDGQSVGDNVTRVDWAVIRLADGNVSMIADAGGPLWNINGFLGLEIPQWSSDGVWVYFRRLKDAQVQVWRVKRDGTGLTQVTHDPADIKTFVVESDGRVTYAVGPADREQIRSAEIQEAEDGVLLDGSVIPGFPITASFPVNGRMATYRILPNSPGYGYATLFGDLPLRVKTIADGAVVTLSATDARATRLSDIFTRSSGGLMPVDPADAKRAESAASGRVASIAASTADDPASRSGYVLSWTGEGTTGSHATCNHTLCVEADHIDLVGWAPDGVTLVARSRTFETVRLIAWNTKSNSVKSIVELDGVLGSYESGAQGSCQLARDEALCIYAASNMPPRAVAINLTSGGQRLLLDPNPSLTADRLGRVEKLTLKDRFGSTTVGWLLLPNKQPFNGKLPLVMTSYGCRGFLLGGSGRDVPEHVLAGLGYAAMCIDMGFDVVRRPASFEWTQSNARRSGVDFFEDAKATLVARGLVDPDRVLISGFSGSVGDVTTGLTQSNEFTAAIVTTQGSFDAIGCYLGAALQTCARLARREGYPLPYDERTSLLKDSPAWRVEDIHAPLLMQLPESEYVSMMQLFGAMLEHGRAVEMHVYPGAYHYKNQARQRLAVYERSVDWINFWLKGIDSLDPRYAAQSSRWQTMRTAQCALFGSPQTNPERERPWYCH